MIEKYDVDEVWHFLEACQLITELHKYKRADRFTHYSYWIEVFDFSIYNHLKNSI